MQTANECVNQMQSSLKGLTNKQVIEREADSKRYQFKPLKRPSFFKKILRQIQDLMVLVLLVSGIVSIIIGSIENTIGEIVDGAIILGIVFMNALFGALQERKSEKAIERLRQITQPETNVLRNGKVFRIKTKDLVLGDVVCLGPGSVVPADLRLLESVELKIDESILTGESEPVSKNADMCFDRSIALGERSNLAYSGTAVECGVGTGVVVKLGTETEMGKIAANLITTKKEETPLQKNIQSVGKVLTWLILLIATITFILEMIANPQQILQAFLTSVAISVAAIPESLPAVITIIMSLGMSKLSKQKAIVKRMHAVETLGVCDVICSDKTGTITQNKMSVEKIFCLCKTHEKYFDLFIKNMLLCNDAKIGENGFVGSSTEVALLKFAQQKCEEKLQTYTRIAERPFNSKDKFMLTLNNVNGQNFCFAKGALDRILNKCTFYVSERGVLPLDQQIKNKILEKNQSMCQDALRVIAFAYKQTDKLNSTDLIFQGLVGMIDPPRPEICDAVKRCREAGMRPIMITGDYKVTALAIAKKVGIAKNEQDIISGEELDSLTIEQFEEIVEIKNVFARVSPEHKVKIVEALKKCGHIVAMTGDGVNDAPSLKCANIGIGMGKTGTDVVKETADVLISDDNFATIVVAVQEGRKIYSNIQKTIKYLFSANMAEILSLFFITIFLPGKIFLLPVQILFVNLITDSLPGIALGVEPVEDGAMKEKPRKANATLFSNGMGANLLILGLVQTVLTLGAYLIGYYFYCDSVAMTMAFYTLNLLQLFYMFTARTNEFCFKSNPFKNKMLTCAFAVGIVLLLLMATTGLGKVLKLINLDILCWCIVLVFSLSIILIGELYKLVERRVKNKKLH